MALKKLLQLFCISKKDSKKKGVVAFPGSSHNNKNVLFISPFLPSFHLSALDCSNMGTHFFPP